jgi:hypothetical protein
MGIELTWLDDRQHVLGLTFRPGWTWDGLRAAIDEADRRIAAVTHPVHLVIDLRQAGRLPGDFMRVAGDLLDSGPARPNEGERVVVGAGPLLRMAYGGFLRVYGSRVANRPLRFADTPQAARALLAGAAGLD